MAPVDGIKPLQPTIPQVEKQRDRPRNRRAFPDLAHEEPPPPEEDDSEPEPDTSPRTPARIHHDPEDPDTGSKIDVLI